MSEPLLVLSNIDCASARKHDVKGCSTNLLNGFSYERVAISTDGGGKRSRLCGLGGDNCFLKQIKENAG